MRVVNYRRSIVEDKIASRGDEKRINKKMTGSFDEDARRAKFFVGVALSSLTENFCLVTLCDIVGAI